MDDNDLRLEALKLALNYLDQTTEDGEDAVEVAKAFLKFLKAEA